MERDAFFHVLRLSVDIQLKDIDYKRLKEAKEELKAIQEEYEAKTEELEAKTEELDEAEVQLKVKEATGRKLKKEVNSQEIARKRAKEEQVAKQARDRLSKFFQK